ncbi:response regulator [Rhodobacterales bacterium HKCCSP123]|nr:response regulator [Rhodobacterales bacterium HKCCSP123]
MDDTVADLVFRPRPTAERPLLGLTVLVVEDSRYASEALRLLCLRSGARIRRADCIASAERHLNVYRPAIGIIDLGLPDGSGLDLLRTMNAMQPRVPILLGTSGAERETAAGEAMAAGADGFLPKPVESLAAFQAAVLAHVPDDMKPKFPRAADTTVLAPDLLSFREDLSHAMDLLALDAPPVGYLRRFLLGLARSAHDTALEECALGLGDTVGPVDRSILRAFLSQRIRAMPMAI